MTVAQRRLMRLRGFLRKEILQIKRDPSSYALALVIPVVFLFLFGYGVSLDARNVPVALVMDDHGTEARELAGRFENSRYFVPVRAGTFDEATRLLDRCDVDGIVHVQSDFSERLARGGTAPVQVIVNGTDANRAMLVQNYAAGVLNQWSLQRVARGLPAGTPAVTVAPRIWFNDALESTHFLVPGLVALVTTLIGVLLTALVIAREWERGTMEAMLATPLRINEIMVGKLLPYFVLGMIGLFVSVVLGIIVFGVPFHGSIGALLLLSTLFVLASLGFGLLISSVARVQFLASMMAVIGGFMPAFFFSGMLFDLESTPWAIQAVSFLIPAKYFVAAGHSIFLAGDVWPVLGWNALALAVMSVALLGLARSNLSKRLED